jgi:hypothetical protein
MRQSRTFRYPSELRQFDSFSSSGAPFVTGRGVVRALSRARIGKVSASSLAFGIRRRAGPTFRVARPLVFRSVRQIRADRIAGCDGLHRNLQQNE